MSATFKGEPFNASTIEQILKVKQAEVDSLTEQLAIEKGTADRCMMERDKARGERDRLADALVRTAASLAAAISLLKRGGKEVKKAAASDKMFDQMLVDYNRALDDARKALGEK